MQKVMLSKEEVDALVSALEMNGGDAASVIQWHATNGLWEGKREALNDMDLDTIIRALYVGYELEETTEEKLLNVFMDGSIPFQSGIIIALNLLDKQIKGINC